MTIKEIEKQTGLTAKSIRYYESKGLVSVDRKEDNNYREYNEDNLRRLKKIKLYRYLDFSIEEIRELLSSDEKGVVDILEKKQSSFEEQSEELEEKQKLLKNLSKDIKNHKDTFETYVDELDFWETDEGEELRSTLRDLASPSLSICIYSTVLLLGPIIYLIVQLSRGVADGMLSYALMSVFATVWMTVIWYNYFTTTKYTKAKIKERMKQRTKENRKDLKLEIIAVLSGFALLFVILMVFERVLAPSDGLFYASNRSLIMFSAFLTAVSALTAAVFFSLRKEKAAVPKWFRAVVLGFLVFWGVAVYCSVTDVTYVTNDKIIVHTPLNPRGVEYDYEDVTKIESGFGTKTFALAPYERKGNFRYIITVGNKQISMSEISAMNGDTYDLIEEFDKKLVVLGVEKEIGSTNSEHMMLDQKYIDTYMRIINNK